MQTRRLSGINGFKGLSENCHCSVAPVYTHSDPSGDPFTSVRDIYVTAKLRQLLPVNSPYVKAPGSRASEQAADARISGTNAKGLVIVNVP